MLLPNLSDTLPQIACDFFHFQLHKSKNVKQKLSEWKAQVTPHLLLRS